MVYEHIKHTHCPTPSAGGGQSFNLAVEFPKYNDNSMLEMVLVHARRAGASAQTADKTPHMSADIPSYLAVAEMVMIPDSIVRHPIIKQQYPGYTQIIHFNWRFRCEPSILGTFSLRLSPFNTSGATKGTVPQDCRHQESCNAELQTSNA